MRKWLVALFLALPAGLVMLNFDIGFILQPVFTFRGALQIEVAYGLIQFDQRHIIVFTHGPH